MGKWLPKSTNWEEIRVPGNRKFRVSGEQEPKVLTQEVLEALKIMTNNKAPDPGGIPIELTKMQQ